MRYILHVLSFQGPGDVGAKRRVHRGGFGERLRAARNEQRFVLHQGLNTTITCFSINESKPNL